MIEKKKKNMWCKRKQVSSIMGPKMLWLKRELRFAISTEISYSNSKEIIFKKLMAFFYSGLCMKLQIVFPYRPSVKLS